MGKLTIRDIREFIATASCDLSFLVCPKQDRWPLAKRFSNLHPEPPLFEQMKDLRFSDGQSENPTKE